MHEVSSFIALKISATNPTRQIHNGWTLQSETLVSTPPTRIRISFAIQNHVAYYVRLCRSMNPNPRAPRTRRNAVHVMRLLCIGSAELRALVPASHAATPHQKVAFCKDDGCGWLSVFKSIGLDLSLFPSPRRAALG